MKEQQTSISAVQKQHIFGYAKTLDKNQNLETQIKILKQNKCDHIYSENLMMSEKHPILDDLLSAIQVNDIVMLTEMSVLAMESMSKAFSIIRTILEKKAHLCILKNPRINTANIDERQELLKWLDVIEKAEGTWLDK
ncbi:hypothetical protein CAXC1_200006 [Candidatus Xenohaliotis californiensis]|uniref:Resolvase/invertase-type recombinase catalytic domain-containing protein n=1 Tax=Candidatus Xenohaliotis californiensis TaxID=84677 RepID=A0ABM9N7M9_9RICK|nr:hypothetical protein CAXC1_200006 [Candidatus Xenohaliotis californiensis]